MRTLLIVDDERNIRLGLKAIIERGYPGRYEMLFAADGEEALGLIQGGQVEIVITDIRMPGMDGLALIRQLALLEQKPVVMILSGHDDFQYAKEAMLYDVREYLLKPIVRDELFAALERVERELERQAALSERLGEVHHYRDELLASQLNYIFLHPAMTEIEIAERCAKAGWDALVEARDSSEAVQRGYVIALLKLRGGFSSGKVGQLEAMLAARPCGIRFYLKDRDEQLVVICEEDEGPSGLLAFMKEHHVSGKIGVSERLSGAGGVKQAYEEALEALRYGFLQAVTAEPVLLHYDRKRARHQESHLPLEDIRRLANMLGTERDKEMKQILTELLDPKKLAGFDIASIEEISKQLNELVFDRVFNQYGEESVEILRIYKKVGCMYNFETIHDYFHSVEDLLLRLNDYVKGLRLVHVEHKEMKKAVSYIHDNYHRDLNMATVSNHVSLNYSYFSQAFKEFTGESFVVYLKRVRIQKAKSLLEETEHKIYEISEQVGFENSKQFNRVFREMEGISAMEYRTKHAVQHRV
ncbi:response regulator [Paenibacillus sp. CF384]|uniref:response regulator n=1 Tax=Paenibacillus sp. CF384 TaxID=1884382 RepID=UPI0008966060|nr:response regulator [Paenibacillus sp. CF384]SDX45887.1 two-component system, response regulator YesN [Paenibacillus sp. CF384]